MKMGVKYFFLCFLCFIILQRLHYITEIYPCFAVFLPPHFFLWIFFFICIFFFLCIFYLPPYPSLPSPSLQALPSFLFVPNNTNYNYTRGSKHGMPLRVDRWMHRRQFKPYKAEKWGIKLWELMITKNLFKLKIFNKTLISEWFWVSTWNKCLQLSFYTDKSEFSR